MGAHDTCREWSELEEEFAGRRYGSRRFRDDIPRRDISPREIRTYRALRRQRPCSGSVTDRRRQDHKGGSHIYQIGITEVAELKDILYKVSLTSSFGSMDRDVKGLTFDSRKVKPGFAFVAVTGTLSDGHDFISKAIETGATAIVCERLP